MCNLHCITSPTYLEDGTPMVVIPDHVLMQGLENKKSHKKSRCLLLHETKTNTPCFVDTNATADMLLKLLILQLWTFLFVAPMEAANEVSSDVVVAHVSVLPTSALSCEEAEPVATHVANPIDFDHINALENANATPSFGSPPDLVTFSTSPLSDSFANEVVQGNVFGSNHFAALDFGALVLRWVTPLKGQEEEDQ
ncbi:unnamed protein product [Thlaspi arvense]|uniref:Uncharacterized protein n=1 Tax=Thlaspi arvense TaxID=13288 RepID=A0AAU9RPW9_THLAR|nr:unnamed protein product [Thlaspi arvense]